MDFSPHGVHMGCKSGYAAVDKLFAGRRQRQAAISGEAPGCIDRGAIDLRRHVTT
jgi:hypothetical protein